MKESKESTLKECVGSIMQEEGKEERSTLAISSLFKERREQQRNGQISGKSKTATNQRRQRGENDVRCHIFRNPIPVRQTASQTKGSFGWKDDGAERRTGMT